MRDSLAANSGLVQLLFDKMQHTRLAMRRRGTFTAGGDLLCKVLDTGLSQTAERRRKYLRGR